MTIIIETPQPPIRERLVLVREGEPMAPRRDAEPADLERAGWVEEHLLVTARAEMRELGSERDEARAERDKLEAKLEQAEKRGDLADQRAIDAIAERDEVRRQRDAEIASRDALARVLEQVERERDEARCLYEAAHCERMRITDVLQRVERERDEARAALATMTRQRDDALQVLGQAREALPSDMRGGWLVDAVRRLVRERDEARQQRDNLRGNYGDVCALVASAKRILGATEDEDIEQVAERVTRERDEVRLILDASAGETTADAATRLHNDWVDARERADRVERERAVDAISGRARAAIVERDEARAALATWQGSAEQGSAEQERARCVAWLRAEAASSDWASCATWGRALSDTADRLERGEHADTPVPAAEPRATDEELFAAYQTAYIVSCGVKDPSEDQRSITRVMPAERKGIAAVAARVRQEQCLVTRAVEAGVKVTITRTSERMPGCCVGLWDVRVTRRPDAPGEYYSHGVPAADVPKTLARLLGEVTRG